MSRVPGDPCGARHHAVRSLRVPPLFQADGGVEHPVLSSVPAPGLQLGPKTVPGEEPGQHGALGQGPAELPGEVPAKNRAERRRSARGR